MNFYIIAKNEPLNSWPSVYYFYNKTKRTFCFRLFIIYYLCNSNMKWFVAHTKSRCEVKASDFFKKNGVESYVPVFEEKRQWSDRTKKIITPAISGYVFFKLEKADYSFINLNPFLRNVVRRFGQAVQIHESEIKIMKDCLKHYTENFAFGSGDTVRILSGVLKNKKGFVDGVENNFVILLVNSIKVKLSLKTNKVVAIG